MIIDPLSLKLFVTIVENGTIAGAAEREHIAASAVSKRISELERKVGQQQVELDFFRQALRQVGGARRPSEGPGVPTSTRSSRR